MTRGVNKESVELYELRGLELWIQRFHEGDDGFLYPIAEPEPALTVWKQRIVFDNEFVARLVMEVFKESQAQYAGRVASESVGLASVA